MGEINNRTVVIDVRDILNRLGISRESIDFLMETSDKAKNPPDRSPSRVQSE